jgi:polyisoprenoid-binding protein YceI
MKNLTAVQTKWGVDPEHSELLFEAKQLMTGKFNL